jgi:hypothetical protein
MTGEDDRGPYHIGVPRFIMVASSGTAMMRVQPRQPVRDGTPQRVPLSLRKGPEDQ